MRTLLALSLALLTILSCPVAAQEGHGDADPSEVGKPKIEMDPFNFSVIKRGVVEGRATLHLVLVMDSGDEMETVRLHLPQIRSDFNTALAVLARQNFVVNRPIDPDVVKAYLTPYLDYRIGAGRAEVFVTQAMIRPE